MAYPEICFTNLIGIRGICTPQEAMYYMDDIPGISYDDLSQVANNSAPNAQKMGLKIIDSAARLMAADVAAMYDAQYKVESTLVTGCSNCGFMSIYASGNKLGTTLKDLTKSTFTTMFIDKVTIKVNSTGTFTFVIDDGTPNNVEAFEYDFVAGIEYTLTNLNYTTKQKKVTFYFTTPGVLLAQLSCPRTGSGCGCSGGAKVINDLVYTGTSNGVEQQQAYGFVPCAFIRCDPDDLLCHVAKAAPRMIGMALLYKTAELFFGETKFSTRNNKVVGFDTEEKTDEREKYEKLYNAKLVGKGTRGVKDVVMSTLQQTQDVCVVCDAKLATAWATT